MKFISGEWVREPSRRSWAELSRRGREKLEVTGMATSLGVIASCCVKFDIWLAGLSAGMSALLGDSTLGEKPP